VSIDLVVLDDDAAVGRRAADIIAETVAARPTAVLGLATGSSPLVTYQELARRVAVGGLDLGLARAFALDEYVGLAVPDGSCANPAAAATRFESAIAEAGGVDVQILGIGSNGHLAFNEPGSAFDSRTRVTRLSATTRRDNRRFFDRLADVPTHSVTQGLGTILEARHLVLVAQGARKAAAIARALDGPVGTDCPASALRLHARATVIVDRAAASGLG
jgi:glucosamine-6-phosphate deaminase